MKGLAGKRCLVTGGASGIGRATTERLLVEGARVAVVDIRVDSCTALEDRFGEQVKVVAADVSLGETAGRVADALHLEWGGVDVLVNNAGICVRTPTTDAAIDREVWQRHFDVNVLGLYALARGVVEPMRAAGGGVIVNMGSVSGIVGMPGYAAYNASKAAVINLTQTLALELAPDIRVVAVSPGFVMTPMQRDAYTDEGLAAINATIPLRRHAEPDEIAALIAFLASQEAPFITGSHIVIDGGESAGGLASVV